MLFVKIVLLPKITNTSKSFFSDIILIEAFIKKLEQIFIIFGQEISRTIQNITENYKSLFELDLTLLSYHLHQFRPRFSFKSNWGNASYKSSNSFLDEGRFFREVILQERVFNMIFIIILKVFVQIDYVFLQDNASQLSNLNFWVRLNQWQ